MQTNEQTRLESIIIELEKRYPFFKKMDIYATVSSAYKKVHSFLHSSPEREMEKVREMADKDLKLSI